MIFGAIARGDNCISHAVSVVIGFGNPTTLARVGKFQAEIQVISTVFC